MGGDCKPDPPDAGKNKLGLRLGLALDWIYKSLEQGEKIGLFGINDEEENQIARKMILVSLWCIQTNPSNRPSMGKVVEMLQGSIASLPIPPRPTLVSASRSLPRATINSSTSTTGITM
ncbi:PR5-like receptor kinase [Hevea brasiliensis]|uniref:PR5-like receptor kinase n=1 Tax=Hevea brasiliensis TaxID=3981 RepID=UPI0025DAD101|nr:PR5-like receptor kinase [Hevea brasiliensis]